MPGFGKLSSSSCAVASMILSFDHSEVVAANKINMVAVEDWPDFDSKVAVKDWPDYDSETIIGDFISKNFPGDDHSRRSKLPDQIGIKPADLDPRWEEVGNGAFGTVYNFGSDVLKVVNVWSQADRQWNSLPDCQKNELLETMTWPKIRLQRVLQLFEEIFLEFKILKDIENKR